jgi:hypothetical protein
MRRAWAFLRMRERWGGRGRRAEGSVALDQNLSCQDDEDGQGQEFRQGGFLSLLGSWEADALSLKSFEFVIHPDVGSHQESFCVKIVQGVLSMGFHSTPSFLHPLG